jgi:rRNA-processing protein FCF1
MQTVVLDTNALLMPFEVKINLDLALSDLLGDVRCVVPGPLIGELKRLDHKFAKAALGLARKYEIVQTVLSGDEAVIETAVSTGGYILTNDKDLRVKARKQGIPLIYLRSGTHLVVETFK